MPGRPLADSSGVLPFGAKENSQLAASRFLCNGEGWGALGNRAAVAGVSAMDIGRRPMVHRGQRRFAFNTESINSDPNTDL